MHKASNFVRGVGQTYQGSIPSPGGGSTDALLRALVDEHSAAVYRLALSVVRDPGLADDATQETFIKVWKNLTDFRGDGSLRGWVLRIAHRESITALRRRRETSIDPQEIATSTDQEPVSRIVEGRLALEDLFDALGSLDATSRAILVLRELEGLGYDEVAEVLDVSLPTVKTRLLRARKVLQTSLAGWMS